MSALRFNAGKISLSMTPASLAAYAAAGFEYGSRKYSRDNWRKGFPYTSILDSLERHVAQFKSGEDYDGESKLHHLCHMACNIAFLIEHVEQGLGVDDRYRIKNVSYRAIRQPGADEQAEGAAVERQSSPPAGPPNTGSKSC